MECPSQSRTTCSTDTSEMLWPASAIRSCWPWSRTSTQTGPEQIRYLKPLIKAWSYYFHKCDWFETICQCIHWIITMASSAVRFQFFILITHFLSSSCARKFKWQKDARTIYKRKRFIVYWDFYTYQ